MRKKKDTHSFDFRPLGLAIREAREKAGLSRNDLGDKVFYGERHIADIENIGKHPSFQLFHDLVTIVCIATTIVIRLYDHVNVIHAFGFTGRKQGRKIFTPLLNGFFCT